ncbi:MAG: pyridoxamine 5'-phosphate oxidase family protein [Acidobacteria bacterium]|nr:pyridoxamine 5'-phosphate oxidase family protein [Acidobacteriota bacterium]
MGTAVEAIDDAIGAFIGAQQMFFVATAPLAGDGHVNLSPRGLDTLRILSPHRVAWLDHVGSGAETIAHVRENGRLTVMFCAFQGPPKIVRLHGRGGVLRPADRAFAELRPLFGDAPPARAIITLDVDRVSHSCGFGVPLYEYKGQRTQLTDWADRKGEAALRAYQTQKNARSIDGLPAVDWLEAERS